MKDQRENDEFDVQIRGLYDSHEEAPPPLLWTNVASNLPKASASNRWWWIGTGIAVFLICVVGVILLSVEPLASEDSSSNSESATSIAGEVQVRVAPLADNSTKSAAIDNAAATPPTIGSQVDHPLTNLGSMPPISAENDAQTIPSSSRRSPGTQPLTKTEHDPIVAHRSAGSGKQGNILLYAANALNPQETASTPAYPVAAAKVTKTKPNTVSMHEEVRLTAANQNPTQRLLPENTPTGLTNTPTPGAEKAGIPVVVSSKEQLENNGFVQGTELASLLPQSNSISTELSDLYLAPMGISHVMDQQILESKLPTKTNENAPQMHFQRKIMGASRWSISAFASPDYTFRLLSTAQGGQQGQHEDDSEEHYNQSESAGLGMTLGLGTNYRLSKHWMIGTGVQYVRYAQSFNPQDQSIHSDSTTGQYTLRTSLGEVAFSQSDLGEDEDINENDDEDFQTSFTSRTRLGSVGIPFVVSYGWNLGPVAFWLQSGLQTDILVSNQMDIYFQREDGEDEEGQSNVVRASVVASKQMLRFSSLVGMVTEVPFSNHLGLMLNPCFRVALSSFSTQTAVQSRPFSAGMRMGLYFRL